MAGRALMWCGRRRWRLPMGVALVVLLAANLAGCKGTTPEESDGTAPTINALADSAYYVDPALEEWVDPETGYDTTREWKLDGGTWPICVVMSPSQSPQALVAERDGLLGKAFEPFGITPVIEKIDLPPRTFHALQRSKWPFVYMPLAVFTDYSRSNENQGQAGGLQYVAIAGSTAGGGYTLLARDPAITSVADLADKTVAQVNSNPVPGTLLAAAAADVGLSLGDGPGQIHFARGAGGDQLNAYTAGEVDAVISLNILKGALISSGSHAVTDFSDVSYTPNYTILCVERSVLEERPEVVTAFLEMHYAANKTAEAEWDAGLKSLLMRSWNDYFKTQTAPSAAQRIVADQSAFDTMLGDMYAEQRLDLQLVADCFAFTSANDLWGWDGAVDADKLVQPAFYDDILSAHGEEPQYPQSK